MDERSSLGTVSKRECLFWNARARNTQVEATSNHPFPAQAKRLPAFRDELLATAAAVALDAPACVRRLQLAVLAPAAVHALRVGRTHAPTARRALSALWRWRDASAAEFRAGVLPRVLPELAHYLRATRTRDDAASAVFDRFTSQRARVRARAEPTHPT